MQLNIHGFTILDTLHYHGRTVAEETSLNKIYDSIWSMVTSIFWGQRKRFAR
jgi:hypothetical protein